MSVNLSKYVVRNDKKNGNKIKKCSSNLHYIAIKKSVTVRNPLIQKMESLLNIWITNNMESGSPMSAEIIRQKALYLYADLKQK